jgi:membrane fusion protein (multidrug efflux system)
MFAALLLSAAAGCGKSAADNPQGMGGAMQLPEVAVVTVTPHPVALTADLPGRLEATRTAQVRARVAGIVQKRVFKEGSNVKAGDLLFQIDPTTMKANAEAAEAALKRAEANASSAKSKYERYKPLASTGMVSKQQFDEAEAQFQQGEADVAAARAALDKARQDLSFTAVTAPISGYVGRAQVTEGALVGQGEATPLATVEQIDPIYADFSQSSVDFTRIKRAVDSGQLKSSASQEADVRLIMEDGTEYPATGQLLFSDRTVDPGTGEVSLRASFPNPHHNLLPGMFVRVRLAQAVDEKAITVPQQSLMRTPQGGVVMVVGADGKVAAQPVQVGEARGDQWVITQGLKGGEQVIVEGLQKVKPGAPAKAVPFNPSVASTVAGTAQPK